LKHDGCGGTQYLKYFEVLRLSSTSKRYFGPFAYSPNDPFGMVATHILPQVGHRNQNPSANSSGRQFSIRYQVIKPTLTDGEQLGRFTSTDKQLLLGWNCGSRWWLLVCGVDCLHCLLL
jgi:hypothetical protein